MTFAGSVRTCVRKYVDFHGRASRSEFWWFVLFWLLVYIGCAVLGELRSDTAASALSLAALAAFFLPYLAAAVRRLHDSDKTGWWYLIGFVPYAGGIVLLIFLVGRGTAGPNRFGNSDGSPLVLPPRLPAPPGVPQRPDGAVV